MIVFAYFHG